MKIIMKPQNSNSIKQEALLLTYSSTIWKFAMHFGDLIYRLLFLK